VEKKNFKFKKLTLSSCMFVVSKETFYTKFTQQFDSGVETVTLTGSIDEIR